MATHAQAPPEATADPDRPSRASPGTNTPDGRVPTLDGLRGLAVWLILVHHFVALSPLLVGPFGSLRSYIRAALGLTNSGVDLFFVLSGFLIGGILMDHHRAPGALGAFYLRRALRILPLAWLHILIVFLLHSSAGTSVAGEIAAPWWIYAGFISNYHHALLGGWEQSLLTPHWSLAIEEQFYLLLPLALWLCPRHKLGWVGPGLIVLALICRCIICVWLPEHRFATHVLTPCRLDALGVGVACAWLVRFNPISPLLSNRKMLWLLMALVSLPLLFLLKNQYRAPGHHSLWGYTVLAVFYGLLLLAVYRPHEAWLRALFSHPILTLFGKYSYFVYLFQGLLGCGLANLLFHATWRTEEPLSPWQIALVPVLLLIPAHLSWQWLNTR